MRKGDRYVIEIEEVLDGEKFDLGRIKGFASMVVTEEALKKLPNFKFAEETAYKQGLQEGLKQVNDKSYNIGLADGITYVCNACEWYAKNIGSLSIHNDGGIGYIIKQYEVHNQEVRKLFDDVGFQEYLVENMNHGDLESHWKRYKKCRE